MKRNANDDEKQSISKKLKFGVETILGNNEQSEAIRYDPTVEPSIAIHSNEPYGFPMYRTFPGRKCLSLSQLFIRNHFFRLLLRQQWFVFAGVLAVRFSQ